jgi:hypothetical protein
MDFNQHSDNMDQEIPAGKFLTAQPGTTARFMNGMPAWMNMTPEDINLAVESLPNPSELRIGYFLLPGISLQKAIEVNEGHRIHEKYY